VVLGLNDGVDRWLICVRWSIQRVTTRLRAESFSLFRIGERPPTGKRGVAKACCEMSRRNGAIVAWHKVPGTAPPQKSRPVGFGVIRAGVRTDTYDLSDENFNFENLKISCCIISVLRFSVGISQVQETVHYVEQQLEHSDTNLSRRVFSLR
jgi:hypothetical protein